MNLHLPYILLPLHLRSIDFKVSFLIFPSTDFKAVRVGKPTETRNHLFPTVKFAALNLSNMLNQKSVRWKISPYFQYKESPCISCSYTHSVASKMVNNKASLQLIDFHGFPLPPPPPPPILFML